MMFVIFHIFSLFFFFVFLFWCNRPGRFCRRLFADVTNVDPYICATVREVRDLVGVDESDEEGEGNDIVSSDVGFD